MNEFAKPNLAVDQFPPASVADSGKVLTVGEDGVPAWGQGGGGSGGGGFKVTFTQTRVDNAPVTTCDKTYAEILAAAEGGSIPYAVMVGSAGGQSQTFAVLPLNAIMDNMATFAAVFVDTEIINQMVVYITADGEVGMAENIYPQNT